MTLLILIFSNMVFAQGEPESNVVIPPDPAEKEYHTLLASQQYACDKFDEKKMCERNLIYSKKDEKILQLLSDGRNLESGDFDINEIMKDFSQYGGDIQEISLKTHFEDQEEYKFVSARYTKENKIFIKVTYNNVNHTKELDIPQP